MEDILKEELHIDAVCEKRIFTANRQYVFLVFFSIVSSIFTIILQANRYLSFADHEFPDWINTFNLQVFPFLTLIQLFVGLAGVFFYLRGIRHQKRAIQFSNQAMFQKSFQLYTRGNVCNLFSLGLNVVFELIFFYQEILLKVNY